MKMAELVQANWIVLVIALVIGILIAWWVFASSRRTRVEIERPEEETSGAPRRNQALIDAPPAAAAGQPIPSDTNARDFERAERVMPPAAPLGLAGAGEIAAAAAAPLARPEPQPEPEPEPRLDRAPTAEPESNMGTAIPIRPPLSREDRSPFAEPLGAAPEDIPSETAAPEAPPATFPIPPSQGMNAVEPSEIEDDLTRIKGLGPKLEAQLRDLGVTSLAQIAAWDDADVERIDAQLGRFQGRIHRDNWREQAQLLAAGDRQAYEDRFGKL